MNIFKGSEDLDFLIVSDWIEKYKLALNRSDSSWANSDCVRLVIVLSDVNIGKLQPLVSEDNFFCWVYNDSAAISFLRNVNDIEVNSRKLFR